MTIAKIIKIAIVIALIFVVAIGCFFLGWRETLNNLTIKSATPTQLANAMKNDDFYSSYDENTLLVHGVVSSVNKQGSSHIIGLSANSSYKALCDLGNTATVPKEGSTITILAEGATAERQTNGVLLKDCIIP